MATEKDLDYYVSTPDEHFNYNAQHFYFKFTGNNKPLTDKPFEDFIDAIYEAYFFAINNPSKPFGCIAKVKELAEEKAFNNSDLLIFVDLLLGIISNLPDLDIYHMNYIQLVDFRHALSPYNEDPAILKEMNQEFYFNLDEIKQTVKETLNPSQRFLYLSDLIFDFKSRKFEMEDRELEYYEINGLLHYIKAEIERAEFDLKVQEKRNSKPNETSKSEFRLAKNKKTDFIKIISAMYDAHMFETRDGYIASNKQALFDEFGKILDENFSNYSTLLSKSKGSDQTSFLKPFKELERKATDYFNFEKEN